MEFQERVFRGMEASSAAELDEEYYEVRDPSVSAKSGSPRILVPPNSCASGFSL